MTTTTTGTTGSQAWKMALVAGAAVLATLVVVNLPAGTDNETGQPATDATQAVPDQGTIDLLAPVITQETLGGSSGVADAATVARWQGLARAYENGSISSYYTGELDPSVAVNARLEALADAYDNGTISSYYTGAPASSGATNARWQALADAYDNGTISNYYTGEPVPVVGPSADGTADVATDARWEALAGAYEDGTISSFYLPTAAGEELAAPMANNQIR